MSTEILDFGRKPSKNDDKVEEIRKKIIIVDKYSDHLQSVKQTKS